LLKKPQLLNYEGGLAYSRDARETLAKMAACCLVKEASFYENTTGKVFDLVRLVGRKDPKWLVKLAVFLREELKLRSIAQYITAVCLTLPEARGAVARAFDRLTPRLDDVLEIASLLKDGRYGLDPALPHAARTQFARKLNNLSEIDVLKYRRASRFGLKHLLSLVHPKPASAKQALLFRYAHSRKNWSRFKLEEYCALPQIMSYEELRRTPRRYTRKISGLIEEGKLLWEVVLPYAGASERTWAACAKSMPIMALIRNLRNLHRHGALKDPEIRCLVLEKITNRDVVLNSRLLPFRWLAAHRAVGDLDPEIGDALISALEISVENIPRFKGETFVACDNSGSMSWRTISSRSSLYPADIANLLGAMIFHLSESGSVSVFGSDFSVVPLSRKDSIMTNFAKISAFDIGWATYAYKVMQYLIAKKKRVDRIILLTDMIIYGSDEGDEGKEAFVNLLRVYRARINPEVKTYAINLQPYEYFISPADDLGVTTISGWSESILKYIECDSAMDGTGLADIVERIVL